MLCVFIVFKSRIREQIKLYFRIVILDKCIFSLKYSDYLEASRQNNISVKVTIEKKILCSQTLKYQ